MTAYSELERGEAIHLHKFNFMQILGISTTYPYIYIYIQGVPRVKVTISGECSLC